MAETKKKKKKSISSGQNQVVGDSGKTSSTTTYYKSNPATQKNGGNTTTPKGRGGGNYSEFSGPSFRKGTNRNIVRKGNDEARKSNTKVPQVEGEQERTFATNITKETRRTGESRTYDGVNAKPTIKENFRTTFKDKDTGQTYNKDTVPTSPNFIPIAEVTDEMLTEIGLSAFEINKVRSDNNPELVAAVEAEVQRIQKEEQEPKRETGLKGFVQNTINPILQKSLEFLGGEFNEDQDGKLSLTGKGVAGLAATAITSGAIGGATAAYKIGAVAAVSKFATPQAAGIAKTATALGIPRKVVKQAVQRQLLKNGVTNIVRGTTAQKIAAGFTAKKVLGGVAAVVSADLIFQWYALDNVIGGQKFFVRDIKNGVEDGSIDKATATQALQTSRELRELAVNKVKTSATINPLMWASRNLILAGTEGDEIAIRLLENQILNFQEEGEANERGYGK